MPDFEIRLFHSDGSLAFVHMSHHDTEDEAHDHARRIMTDLARYEVRRADAAPGGTAR